MIAKVTRSAFVVFVATVCVIGQQPNSAVHSMTLNGLDGTPFPILQNVRTSLPVNFLFLTAPGQPYSVYQGTLHPGAANAAGGIVDLNLTPFPAKPIDGWANPAYRSDFSGNGYFTVTVPPVGSPPNGVPLGFQIAVQGVVGDPFNPAFGYSLTAATRCTVTQGPIITLYTLGDEFEQSVSFPTMPMPFYGFNYTTLWLGSNGYITMGNAGGSDYTPTPAEFDVGPARIAPFWCDLSCGTNQVKTTFDVNPGNGNPGYVRVEYNGVSDYTTTNSHTFSMLIQNDGYVEVIQSNLNNASIYDQMTGIGPGANLGAPQTQKNFVGAQPIGSTVGPGILSTPPYSRVGNVNESFYEWFGIVTQNAYYTNGYDNQYDLVATTLHFLPNGTGGLPGSTNRYILY